MPDIVITELMDQDAVAGLARDFDVLYDPLLYRDSRRLAGLLQNARAVIVRNSTQVRGELLAAAPQLKAVGRLGVGLDNIDVAACKARHIAVLPASGANEVSVAEYVTAGLLMLLRGSYFSTDAVRAGLWPRTDLIGREVAGTTLGLIGFGSIARGVARRATALGIQVIGYDAILEAHDPAWYIEEVTPTTFEAVLSKADTISLHVPLTEQTHHLIDTDAIDKMKVGAILINTSRGGVVDDDAVARALKSGKLGGAMIDVFPHEPLSAANPYRDVANVILTPHIAGVTKESNIRVSSITAENVRRVLALQG